MHFHPLLLISGTQWGQLFVALSALIILHEGGHFFFAKLFKTRVEKFYLFFDFLFPFSGLLHFSLFKKKVGDTEYGIGWFPLGGYVKIAGMVDESMDKAELAQPPKPWEYRSKPAWQRLFIMLGGIIVNVLTAMIIYMFVFGVWGEEYLPAANVKWGIATDSIGRTIGFRDGDKIVSVDGEPLDDIGDIGYKIFHGAHQAQVIRDDQPVTVAFPAGTIARLAQSRRGFIAPRVPIVIKTVEKGSNAAAMKLQAGDSIIGVNGKQVLFVNEFHDLLQSLKGQPVQIRFYRSGVYAEVNGKVSEEGRLGIELNIDPQRYFSMKTIRYSPFGAIARGFSYTWEKFGDYIWSLKFMFTSKEVKLKDSVGGIGSFAKATPEVFTLQSFLLFTAFISVILAFMNLLPIPGLDGGYVIFLLWELITRRKVSDRVMEIATTVGLVLLLALMVYANGMDIFRGFFKK